MRSKFRSEGGQVEVHADRVIVPAGPCPDPIAEMVYNGGKYEATNMLPLFSADQCLKDWHTKGWANGAD